jgi:hypothetical protein
MPLSSPRLQRHHAAARTVGPATLLAAVLLFALGSASIALAKGPSKKQIDEAMLRLPESDLVRVTTAESDIRGAEDQMKEAEKDLDIGRKDNAAAKSWVDASAAVLRAIGVDRKAAEAAARTVDIERLATQQVRSEASQRWRKARHDAAKARISYVQAKLVWIRAERSRLDVALKEARLQTYKVSVEDTPDIDEELGKTVTSRGKAESTSAKARDKMEKAEVAWQSAVATATALAP